MDSRRVGTTRALAILLVAVGWTPSEPAAAQRALTPHDVVDLRTVEEVALSPDGGTAAYAVTVPRRPGRDEDGEPWRELHVAGPDGAGRPFVTGEVEVGDVGWTPDGAAITFLARRGGDEHEALWAIPLDGGEARRVAGLASGVTAYSLCADGERLALVGAEAESEERRRRIEQGFHQQVFEEDWRPRRLWLTTFDADTEPRALGVEGSVERAAWSPGCGRLAVEVAPSPLVDDRLMRSRIRVVDPESGAVRARIDTPGKVGDFAWSPDGSRLAVIAAADLHDPRAGRLAVVPAAGGAPRDLLPDLEGHVVAFAWAAPERLVFLVHEGTEARLGEVAADGSDAVTLAAPGGPILTTLSRAATGALAFVGSTPAHPDEVFYRAADGGAPRRLTDSNPWLAGVRLAPQEVVRYRARDGLELEGILVRPLDAAPGERHPLLLVVHGGPESHVSNGWVTTYSRPGQTAAARGFAVFYPNYRASTGRGVAFSKLDHGDPAGAEFDDLVDAADHLIAAGLADRERVAITGRSYGGYATAWCATRYSERFAAAVMGAGISEKIAKMGTSDIPTELYLVHERKWPWEDWQHALERSPVYYVEQARTPLLILHGEQDRRVFPGQALTLYRFLKVLGRAPVRLVLYPQEKHGVSRAAARLDASLRQLRWLEHYVLGPGGEPPPWEIDYHLDAPIPDDATSP